MKNLIKITWPFFIILFFSACSTTTNFNGRKEEVRGQDNYVGPHKAFNHLNGNWRY